MGVEIAMGICIAILLLVGVSVPTSISAFSILDFYETSNSKGVKRSLRPLEEEEPRSFRDSELSYQDDVESVPMYGTEADELAKLFQQLGFSRLVKKSRASTTTGTVTTSQKRDEKNKKVKHSRNQLQGWLSRVG